MHKLLSPELRKALAEYLVHEANNCEHMATMAMELGREGAVEYKRDAEALRHTVKYLLGKDGEKAQAKCA